MKPMSNLTRQPGINRKAAYKYIPVSFLVNTWPTEQKGGLWTVCDVTQLNTQTNCDRKETQSQFTSHFPQSGPQNKLGGGDILYG